MGHQHQVFTLSTAWRSQCEGTRRIMGQRVIWSCMSNDVNQLVKDCQACSRTKVARQPAAAKQPIQVPQQLFSHIHVDLVGPLPVFRKGYRYLFTIIHRSSRMLEAVPLANIKMETCRDALINQWVACFGVPAYLTSAQGSQFTSTLWARLCNVIGTHHNTTTTYHRQSKGMVERAHRWLKDALKAGMAVSDWPKHLPWVLLDINNAPKEDNSKSAAQMVNSTSLTLPAQMAAGDEQLVDKILWNLSTALPIPTHHGQKEAPTEPPAALAPRDLVYLRKGGQLQPLAQPYRSPYKVPYWRGPKYIRLDIGGKDTAVTITFLNLDFFAHII